MRISFAHYATSLYLLFTITLYRISNQLSIFFSNVHNISKLFSIMHKQINKYCKNSANSFYDTYISYLFSDQLMSKYIAFAIRRKNDFFIFLIKPRKILLTFVYYNGVM